MPRATGLLRKMRFYVYEVDGRWRWVLLQTNGNLAAVGGEVYTRRQDAAQSCQRLYRKLHSVDCPLISFCLPPERPIKAARKAAAPVQATLADALRELS